MTTFHCPCGASFPALAALLDHRLGGAPSTIGTPCRPREGRTLDLGPVHSYAWLCAGPHGLYDVAPTGMGDSMGPVIVHARVAVRIDG